MGGRPPGFGFTTGEPWLPMPGRVGAGSGRGAAAATTGSTLALYRARARARRPRDGAFAWRESPPGTLVFERGDVVCAVNVDAPALELPEGELLLASEPGPATACPRHRRVGAMR